MDGGYQDISALGDPCGFHTLNKQFSNSIFIIGIGVSRTGLLTLQFHFKLSFHVYKMIERKKDRYGSRSELQIQSTKFAFYHCADNVMYECICGVMCACTSSLGNDLTHPYTK